MKERNDRLLGRITGIGLPRMLEEDLFQIGNLHAQVYENRRCIGGEIYGVGAVID